MFTVQLRTKFRITHHNDEFVFATKMKATENFRTTTILQLIFHSRKYYLNNTSVIFVGAISKALQT